MDFFNSLTESLNALSLIMAMLSMTGMKSKKVLPTNILMMNKTGEVRKVEN